MKVLQFLGTIESLSGFGAPYSLITIFRLSNGMLGLAATKVAMEVVIGFVTILAFDLLWFPNPR